MVVEVVEEEEQQGPFEEAQGEGGLGGGFWGWCNRWWWWWWRRRRRRRAGLNRCSPCTRRSHGEEEEEEEGHVERLLAPIGAGTDAKFNRWACSSSAFSSCTTYLSKIAVFWSVYQNCLRELPRAPPQAIQCACFASSSQRAFPENL